MQSSAEASEASQLNHPTPEDIDNTIIVVILLIDTLEVYVTI